MSGPGHNNFTEWYEKTSARRTKRNTQVKVLVITELMFDFHAIYVPAEITMALPSAVTTQSDLIEFNTDYIFRNAW